MLIARQIQSLVVLCIISYTTIFFFMLFCEVLILVQTLPDYFASWQILLVNSFLKLFRVVKIPSVTQEWIDFFLTGHVTFELFGLQQESANDVKLAKMSTKVSFCLFEQRCNWKCTFCVNADSKNVVVFFNSFFLIVFHCHSWTLTTLFGIGWCT